VEILGQAPTLAGVHELSIAQDLVAAMLEHAGPNVRITVAHVRIGPLSGVVPQALRSAYPAATRGTPAEGSELRIEETVLRAYCPACQAERELPSVQRLACPVCDAPTQRVTGGRELELTSLEVVDV
jgi:hydrogenase nickel incorporation protein HypA/HybF